MSDNSVTLTIGVHIQREASLAVVQLDTGTVAVMIGDVTLYFRDDEHRRQFGRQLAKLEAKQ